MKKFRLYSNTVTSHDEREGSYSMVHEARDIKSLINEIDRSNGWIICKGCAYKIGYIEELKEAESDEIY